MLDLLGSEIFGDIHSTDAGSAILKHPYYRNNLMETSDSGKRVGLKNKRGRLKECNEQETLGRVHYLKEALSLFMLLCKKKFLC